ITKALLGAADELRVRWWLWLPASAAAVMGAAVWRRSEQGRRAIDSWALHAAGVAGVVRPLLIGRTCRMLGLLLQSGVPLLDALRLCKQAISNGLYQELFDELANSVVNGRGLAGPLSEAEVVPVSAREMLLTAERTGNLAEVSQMLAGYYEEEAESRMRTAVKLLEPIITVIMGAVVAVVVLAVMLPIFDLSSFTHGGGP
ncbi:MAG TPA: type II secretion system F family protein, partial [Lacipirellulaceae bacterium]|nr:type II secretion system F family protein [Lacipirellulaceae bacterium]